MLTHTGALDQLAKLGHEQIHIMREPSAGLRVIIAVHDTTLGPAVGGTRMRMYDSIDDAIFDVLRLSRAMTYKAAMAGMSWGGGKAVIIGDPAKDKTHALLESYAAILNRLNVLHTGGDMGIDSDDVTFLSRHTRHISQVPQGSGVDASDLTAVGVVEGIRAVTQALGRSIDGLHVAIQGLGQVGAKLAARLAAEGVRLTVADVDQKRVAAVAQSTRAAVVAPAAILSVEADIFSPNAAGGILSTESIRSLRCRAVAGAANEQLAKPAEDGQILFERGILFAPDYVINAGGLLSLLYELGETDETGIVERVKGIGPRVGAILEASHRERTPPHIIADRMVEEKLLEARQIPR